ncbi:MAG: glycosyltransferase [Flavobacteriales bacterium]|nr:glycosyltransferase [Flavobacteriales bacterium]
MSTRYQSSTVHSSSSSNVKVSVCIQTYNHENYIRKCLDGAINQITNFDYEILLGEDDSSDNTRNICLEYLEKHKKKIRLFLHERKNVIFINGLPSGRYNLLHNLKNSAGKYIALCEGDDYWTDPFKLQKQVDFLENNPEYVACYHGCKHVNQYDEIIKKSRYGNYPDLTADQLLTGEGAMITHTVMFRNIIKSYPPIFEGIPSGDTILYHLLGFHGGGKFIADIKYSAYRIHDGGIFSGITDLQRMKNTLSTMSAIKKNLTNHFSQTSEYVYKMDFVLFLSIKGYLYNSLSFRRYQMYFRMLYLILNQKDFNRYFILKEHFIHIFTLLKQKINK